LQGNFHCQIKNVAGNMFGAGVLTNTYVYFFTQIVARWRHRLYILIHKTVTCYSLTGFLGLQSIFPRQTIRVLVVTLLPTCLYSFSISSCFFLPKKRINIYTLCPKYVVHQSHGNRYGIVEFNVPLDTL